jgi:hypothetical protein
VGNVTEGRDGGGCEDGLFLGCEGCGLGGDLLEALEQFEANRGG